MNEVPDEMIWEKIVEEEKEAELEKVKNTPEARDIKDILEDHEKDRIGRELERRRLEVAKIKKRHESLEDALLRLERMDIEKIRLALRADWNERYEN
jgi:hypothetical protein